MTDDATLLEFPCQFAVKVIGIAAPGFAELVYRLVAEHVNGLTRDALGSKPSRQGKYTSITFTFTATGKAQLDAIYRTLSAHEKVLMAL